MFQESREERSKGKKALTRSTRGSKCLSPNAFIIISCNHFSPIDGVPRKRIKYDRVLPSSLISFVFFDHIIKSILKTYIKFHKYLLTDKLCKICSWDIPRKGDIYVYMPVLGIFKYESGFNSCGNRNKLSVRSMRITRKEYPSSSLRLILREDLCNPRVCV